MLLAVLFPIIDFRSFIEHETGRLPWPEWPNPKADEDFLPLFGAIRKVRGRGVHGAPGEGVACIAQNALRILSWHARRAAETFYEAAGDGKTVAERCRKSTGSRKRIPRMRGRT
jgi:hypothetical protein